MERIGVVYLEDMSNDDLKMHLLYKDKEIHRLNEIIDEQYDLMEKLQTELQHYKLDDSKMKQFFDVMDLHMRTVDITDTYDVGVTNGIISAHNILIDKKIDLLYMKKPSFVEMIKKKFQSFLLNILTSMTRGYDERE